MVVTWWAVKIVKIFQAFRVPHAMPLTGGVGVIVVVRSALSDF